MRPTHPEADAVLSSPAVELSPVAVASSVLVASPAVVPSPHVVASPEVAATPTGRWRRRLRRSGWLLLSLALLAGAQPGWLHAKAALAQLLLARSWAAAVAGQAPLPWPGADTRPVARLQFARLGIDQIVLAGDSGRTLAFGPGWAESSAPPGAVGTTVISAHRDTHFAFLRALREGDRLLLEGMRGEETFVVSAREVVDSRTQRIAIGGDARRLLLVTCWPFDALRAGGPMRYVVTAEPAGHATPQ